MTCEPLPSIPFILYFFEPVLIPSLPLILRTVFSNGREEVTREVVRLPCHVTYALHLSQPGEASECCALTVSALEQWAKPELLSMRTLLNTEPLPTAKDLTAFGAPVLYAKGIAQRLGELKTGVFGQERPGSSYPLRYEDDLLACDKVSSSVAYENAVMASSEAGTRRFRAREELFRMSALELSMADVSEEAGIAMNLNCVFTGLRLVYGPMAEAVMRLDMNPQSDVQFRQAFNFECVPISLSLPILLCLTPLLPSHFTAVTSGSLTRRGTPPLSSLSWLVTRTSSTPLSSIRRSRRGLLLGSRIRNAALR